MIQTEVREYNKTFEAAIKQAEKLNKALLVSITEEVSPVEPLAFFQAGIEYKGERTYWTSSNQDFVLVGIGSGAIIKAEQDRFEQVETQWGNLLKDAVIENPYQVQGTGPILMGGFSFDPLRVRTELWGNFPNSKMTVPMFVLTKVEKNYYLTINMMVNQHDRAEQLIAQIEKEQQVLMNSKFQVSDNPSVKDKYEIDPEDWKKSVKVATDTIKKGILEKVVLARELVVHFSDSLSISNILDFLRNAQGNSYIFAIESGTDCFLGATPERLVKLEQRNLLSTCLAGTAPRGKTNEEDWKIGNELLSDQKNLREHAFVVRMIEESIKDYCEKIDVPKQPTLYPLKQLQHLYTPVKGVLKKQYSLLDVVKRLHPTPALGGTPRQDALTFIRENEVLDRGWYAAPVGWMDNQKNGEFAVAIRSALVKDDKASLFAGCGIVKDSDPEAEYQETNMKFMPMLTALGGSK